MKKFKLPKKKSLNLRIGIKTRFKKKILIWFWFLNNFVTKPWV